jgi:signal transduction histidine kinase
MAEAAGRAKDNFLAALSHELRTPLNPVLLIASDSSENPQLPPDIRQQFKTVLANVEVESRLIDDLLDLTRINHGKLNLQILPADAHAILREAIQTIQAEADAKTIQLTTNLNAEQYWISADRVRLQQVFWNVLKNAVKFTPAGGKIDIQTSATPENGKFNVTVTDTGMGMTPQELERIFSPFSQGDHMQENSSRYGGLGLGLAISRKIVEFHSGRISASSNGRDQGTTLTIELVMAQV